MKRKSIKIEDEDISVSWHKGWTWHITSKEAINAIRFARTNDSGTAFSEIANLIEKKYLNNKENKR